jgi:hypothetical protein
MMKKLVLLGSVLLLLSSQVLATGIYVNFSYNSLKNKDGGTLSDGTFHPYTDRLEFFHGSVPAPNTSAGRLAVNTATQYVNDAAGSKRTYQLLPLDGGSLGIRVWNGTPATRGSYYGRTSGGIAAGTTLPTELNITSLQTDYKADVPNTPAIGVISEALVRRGDSLEMTLTIPISYSESGPDGKREATGFSLAIVYPSGSSETRSGSSITLSNTPTGTYRFTPTATNWFGSTTGSEVSYTTLGAGGGAAGPVTYSLKKIAEGLGLNAVAAIHNVPFQVNSDPASSVGTIAQLVAAINAKSSRRDNVTTIGWMEDSAIKGFYVTYSSTGDPTLTPTAGLAADGSLALERGKSYQLSVNSDVTVTFSQ